MKVIPVNKLRIPLSAVARRKGFSFEEHVPEEDLRPKGAPRSSLREVRVAGKVTSVASEYLFEGTLSGVYERPCDRCLENARQTIDLDVAWLFELGREDQSLDGALEYTEADVLDDEDVEGERVRYYEGTELEMAPHVWEEMVLAGPSKFYCSESCKGLCPSCGLNLNHGECECASEQEMNGTGLAALKDMFPDLRSESSEE